MGVSRVDWVCLELTGVSGVEWVCLELSGCA